MAEKPERNILILGNLQSGKTTLFRHLCGHRTLDVDTPETSQNLSRGELDGPGATGTVLIDTPGTTTLFPQGEEDMLVRDALLRTKPDALLLVADAKNLRRSLALVAHAAEFQLPMVVAVNMEDEAWRYGLSIDFGLLESLLGIDVVKTVAHQRLGLRALREKLKTPKTPNRLVRLPSAFSDVHTEIEEMLRELRGISPGIVDLLLTRDSGALALVEEELGRETLDRVKETVTRFKEGMVIPPEIQITDALYAASGKFADQVVLKRGPENVVVGSFGRLAHHPVIGMFIAALVVYITYLWVGEIGATRVVDWINSAIFERHLIPATETLVSYIPVAILRDALIDPDFGIVTTGLFLAFGLVMPVLIFFYFAFNILVSSGYIARISILLDRVFKIIGLNGKGILPLAMGLSCVTMALITVRVLDTKKERLIASFLLLLGTPCAPLLAAMFVVLGPMPVSATFTVFGVIISQTLIAGVLANKIFKGQTSDFVMEIPPMRVPRLTRVIRQTFVQTYYFMKEALPLFLIASASMFVVDKLGGLDLLEKAAHPVVNGLLGLPDQSVQVFIKTMIRRETGAAELDLVRQNFDNVQLVVTLVVMTFLMPCVNAMIVSIKERGFKDALLIVAAVSTYALVLGTILNFGLRALGVTY